MTRADTTTRAGIFNRVAVLPSAIVVAGGRANRAGRASTAAPSHRFFRSGRRRAATDHSKAAVWTLSAVLAAGVAVAYVQNIPAAATASPAETAAAHLAAGRRLHQQGHVDAAIAEYRRAAAINPRSAPAYYNLGVAQYQQKHSDEAIASYTQALVLDSKMADAHFNLGYVLSHDRQDPSGALVQLRRAVELEPRRAKGYFEMGMAYDRLAMPDRARSSYDLAVKLDPAFAPLVRRMSPTPVGSH
jgi:tetratricopeptide (TPR) repeat protein